MKKYLSLLLCATLCCTLFACGKAGETVTTPTTSKTKTAAEATTVIFKDKTKSDGYSPALLPAGFPVALPDGITAKYTTQYLADAENNPYGAAFSRLRLVLRRQGVFALNGMMRENGWEGAANCFVQGDDTTGTANADWMEGYWKQGGYVALLTDNIYGADGEDFFTVSLDIVPRTAAFPTELAAVFPAFDGVCLFQNNVYVPERGNYVLTDPDKLSGKSWRWEFSGSNVFIGVTEQEALSYERALRDAGFVTHAEEQENDYGAYIIFTAEKVKNNRTCYAQFLYASYAQTLMAVYTNHSEAMQ